MRKHGPANQHVVVLQHQTIQRDRHVLIQPPARQLLNLTRGNRSQLHESRRGVPAMVEDLSLAGAAVYDGPANEPAELRVTHRRMRTERDKIIERRNAQSELSL